MPKVPGIFRVNNKKELINENSEIQGFNVSTNILISFFSRFAGKKENQVRRDFLQGFPIELQAIQSENRRFFPQIFPLPFQGRGKGEDGKKGEKNHVSMDIDSRLGGKPQSNEQIITSF
nr:hypothetical protein [Trentepohlia sp. YN1317]